MQKQRQEEKEENDDAETCDSLAHYYTCRGGEPPEIPVIGGRTAKKQLSMTTVHQHVTWAKCPPGATVCLPNARVKQRRDDLKDTSDTNSAVVILSTRLPVASRPRR